MLLPSRAFATAVLFLCLGKLFAQPAPPAQTHVAALGSAPLRAPATADFALGSTFTLEGWFYLTGNTPFGWLMGKGLATGGTDPFVSFSLQLNSEGTKLVFVTSTGAAGSYRELVAPAAFPLRTWTHVAAVLENGTTTRLLINGSVVATGTAVGAPLFAPSVPFGVGIAYLANGNTNYSAFPGFARQVRVWTTARTPAQAAIAAAEFLPADRAGLLAAWPLDEITGTGARDISGNNRALIGGGGATPVALAEAPFYNVVRTTHPGNVLQKPDYGILMDFDGDGDLDLITTHIAWPPTLPETRLRLRAFRNTAGAFTDVTDAVLGDVTMVHPRHHAIADFNGDGRTDLLIIGHGTDRPPYPGEQAKLFIRTADGRLVDGTATRLPLRNEFTHSVAVGDIDGDGDPDIYMGNVHGGTSGPRFYLNDGVGVFIDAPGRLPLDIQSRERGLNFTSCALVDLNSDGRVDLVLGTDGIAAPNEVLINDGTGRFARNAAFALPRKIIDDRATTVAIAAADLNGDGAVDLVLSTTGGQVTMPTGVMIFGYSIPGAQLLLNRGNGTFYDATAQLNLTFDAADAWIKWIRVADLNNDGRPDLVLQGLSASGQPFSRSILLNRGGAVFVDASKASSARDTTFLHPADLDRDGLIDLVGMSQNTIMVSRALRPLERALFQTTPDAPGRLVNLSVRTQAGTGDQTLITGFALAGAGTKSLLVRATGPALAAFAVPGTLLDPTVEVAPLGAAKIAENDNWSGTADLRNAFTAVGAFPLSDGASKDSALLFSPGFGGYTAKVTGANNGTGVALVEVYDADSATSPKLINLSARTQVGTGGDVLIVGFVVSGNVPKKFLVRASGPTLALFGVGGTLADPVLEIRPHGAENIIATNDDWRGTAALKTAFTSVGAFPFPSETSRDAALAIELPPGGYTATVSGKNATTGVALVEVYDLP